MKKSDRITYFDDVLYNNSYGILFKNETIKESFNTFLSENYDENKLMNYLMSGKMLMRVKLYLIIKMEPKHSKYVFLK